MEFPSIKTYVGNIYRNMELDVVVVTLDDEDNVVATVEVRVVVTLATVVVTLATVVVTAIVVVTAGAQVVVLDTQGPDKILIGFFFLYSKIFLIFEKI